MTHFRIQNEINAASLAISMLFAATNALGARSSCDGINTAGDYILKSSCPLDGTQLPAEIIVSLEQSNTDSSCTFTATTTVSEQQIEYSITPPPGVLRGPYDMCALWAFDEGSRPGSFPEEMKEPCRIWTSRPADRIFTVERTLKQFFSAEDVKLDSAGRVSSFGQCQVRPL